MRAPARPLALSPYNFLSLADQTMANRILLQDEREESGFARAVRPNQANAVATIHLERDIGEKVCVRQTIC